MRVSDSRTALDLDAQVVERSGSAVARHQHELQRRVRDGEVRVPRPQLPRGRAEELRVEGDGLVEVGHVECELDP